jgi:phosphopantetheinyl transferase
MIPQLGSLLEILAADEIAKARRFRFEKDRQEYVLSRGLLRRILAATQESPPVNCGSVTTLVVSQR